MNKQKKLIEALKNASEENPVKVKCISPCGNLIEGKVYNAILDIYEDCLHILDSYFEGYWTNCNFELIEEEKTMTREEFIKLLEYNNIENITHCEFLSHVEPSQIYKFKKDKIDYIVNTFNASLYKSSNDVYSLVFMATSYEDFIEFAKIKGIELKPLPKFRPHWKITINGKETGEVSYADEVGNSLDYIDYITSTSLSIAEGKECNFAYYKNDILHEAVWVGEEK